MFKGLRRLFRRPRMADWLLDLEKIPDISGTWQQTEQEVFARVEGEGHRRLKPVQRPMILEQSDNGKLLEGRSETKQFRYELVGHYAGRNRANQRIFSFTLERISKTDEGYRLLHTGILTRTGRARLEMVILTADGSKLKDNDPFPGFCGISQWRRQPAPPAPANE